MTGVLGGSVSYTSCSLSFPRTTIFPFVFFLFIYTILPLETFVFSSFFTIHSRGVSGFLRRFRVLYSFFIYPTPLPSFSFSLSSPLSYSSIDGRGGLCCWVFSLALTRENPREIGWGWGEEAKGNIKKGLWNWRGFCS